MPIEQAYIEINKWYQSPLGKYFSAEVAKQLNVMTQNIHGINSLQIGLSEQPNWLEKCPITSNYNLSFSGAYKPGDFCANSLALPIADSSIDCVVLPHVLAFTKDTTELLRELDRIVVAEGHIIFIGINRLSLWGLNSYFRRHSNVAPWNGQFMSLFTLRKQLDAFGYHITNQADFLYRPPVSNPQIFKKLQFMETIGRTIWPIPGGAYITIAKKRVYSMTRIKPILRYRNLVVGKI